MVFFLRVSDISKFFTLRKIEWIITQQIFIIIPDCSQRNYRILQHVRGPNRLIGGSMKRIMPLLLISILMPISIKARTNTYIKTGINISFFRTDEGKSEPGFCFGVSREFYPIRSFNGFLGLGLNYQQKKYILENRTWSTNYFDPDDSDINLGNINVNVSFIEIPVMFGYSVNINDSFTSSIYAGYGLSIPISEHTKCSNVKIIPLEPEKRGTYEFDYILLDENYTTISQNFHFGARLSYKRFAIILNYAMALTITEGVSTLSVRDKIDTFEISAAFLL